MDMFPSPWNAAIRDRAGLERWFAACTNYELTKPPAYDAAHFSLDRMHRLCAELGDPQNACRYIHIAGSKGKGSVATMAAALLRAHGERAGLYVSPHLLDLRERIQIDDDWIPEAALLTTAERVRQAAARLVSAGIIPTFFDLITAMAFCRFAEAGVSWVALETGLGGRLDSTNVVTPAVSVITSIQLEHTDKLGATVSAIAGEKAGIIKPATPLIHGPVVAEVEAVLEARCRDRGAPRTVVAMPSAGEFFVDDNGRRLGPLRVSPDTATQRLNAALAAAATARSLARWDNAAARRTLISLVIPGRMQWIPGAPGCLLDVAHTPDSFAALAVYLRECHRGARMIAIIGMLNDKPALDCLAPLRGCVSSVIATRAPSPRAHPPEAIAAAARTLGMASSIQDSPTLAWEEARRLAGHDGRILVAGSFYLAGELLPLAQAKSSHE